MNVLRRLIGFRDQATPFEDCVGGAAANSESFLPVEVCGDGFVAPSLLLPELDYSLNCGFG